MRSFLLLALAASTASAAGVPRIGSAPVVRIGARTGAVLGNIPAAGRLSGTPLSPAPGLAWAAPSLPGAAAPAPSAAPGFFPAESAPDIGPSVSAEEASGAGARRFDGLGASGALGAIVPPAVSGGPFGGPAGGDLAGTRSGGWSQGSFRSPVDGAELFFKRRASQGEPGRAPTVFVGGLGLSESFDALFAAAPARSDQIFLWLRGNAPSSWAPARHPLDADARDLALMITAAAREAGSAGVDLALHSYASLVFQRMLQLGEHAEVREALGLLRGARVFMINATTHFKGSESAAGPEYEKMTRATALFVGWLDMMDAAAELWRKTPVLSPLYPTSLAWLQAWSFQRAQALDLAAKDVVAQLREHLKGPWAPEVEAVRRQAVDRLERNAHDAGWQEALVRRVNDGALLEAKPADVARLAALGVQVEVVVSHDDQIIPWSVSKVFLEHLGVAAPESAPPAGSVLRSPNGSVRARIVAGDHYVPLKDPGAVDRIINP